MSNGSITRVSFLWFVGSGLAAGASAAQLAARGQPALKTNEMCIRLTSFPFIACGECSSRALPLSTTRERRMSTARPLFGARRQVYDRWVESRYADLIARAHAAVESAARERERSGELTAFIHALRKTDPADVLQCAWCKRIASDGYWIDPERLLGGRTPHQRELTSHGICPDCFERVTVAAR